MQLRYAAKATAPRDRDLIHAVVSRLVPFSGTSPTALGGLEQQCRTLFTRCGEVVFKNGETLPGVFAVAYGFVKLALHASQSDGRVLRVVTAGQTFGEATALLGRAARYDAVALADSKLVVIPSASILSLIDREPRFARSVLTILSERNLELLDEIDATLRGGAQRLASYLGSLAPETFGSCSVRLPVTKTVVAARLGVKKETLSRLLRKLAERGLIEVSRSRISILDRPGLADIAGSPARVDPGR